MEPSRDGGVDGGARMEIYGLIRDLAGAGCACVLASSDLPELLGLSDRVLLLDQGRQSAILPAEGLTPEALLTQLYSSGEPAA